MLGLGSLVADYSDSSDEESNSDVTAPSTSKCATTLGNSSISPVTAVASSYALPSNPTK